MTVDTNNEKHIIADEGKVFQRIEDGQNYGKEIYLGYSYYIGGEKLEVPHLDVPEDFEEVEAPFEENETPVVEESSVEETPSEEPQEEE